MSVGHFLSLSFGSDHLRVQGRAVHGGHVRYFGMGEHSSCRQPYMRWTHLFSRLLPILVRAVLEHLARAVHQLSFMLQRVTSLTSSWLRWAAS